MNNLCCVLNSLVHCKECTNTWCSPCWTKSSHVNETKPKSWGKCPMTDRLLCWDKTNKFRETKLMMVVARPEGYRPYEN